MAKHIKSLELKNFNKYLDDFTIETLGDVNLIVGTNGIGKTSLLGYILCNHGSYVEREKYALLNSIRGFVTGRLPLAHIELAKDSFLLIDEIENGLHYSLHENLWEQLFDIAAKNNTQIFATTHSWDIIKYFNEVAQRREEDGVLISLGREPSEEGNGKLLANIMQEQVLDIFVKNGKEVR